MHDLVKDLDGRQIFALRNLNDEFPWSRLVALLLAADQPHFLCDGLAFISTHKHVLPHVLVSQHVVVPNLKTIKNTAMDIYILNALIFNCHAIASPFRDMVGRLVYPGVLEVPKI